MQMMSMGRGRPLRAGLVAGVVAGVLLSLAGCGGSTSSADGARQSTGTANGSSLPNPFTISARFSAGSLGLTEPRGLAVGPDGNLYVTDRAERVTVVSPEGKVLRRWGKPGHGPGEFSFVANDPSNPADVHADISVGGDGLVYVADSGNVRIEVFTPEGKFVRTVGTFGNGKGQFLAPYDVMVDDQGYVYIADDQLRTVSKLAPDGRVIWRIGGDASADPDLAGHQHLGGIDRHGRVVMANDDARRILYVDRNGHKVEAFGRSADLSSGACDVTVDAMGYTYVGSCGPRPAAMEVFDRTHSHVGRWFGPGDPLAISPRFSPNGEAFAICWDGSLIRLTITRPGA